MLLPDSMEADQIDRFIKDISDRWKNTSTELRCVQSLLEEVLTYWKRWNATYEPLEAYIVEAFEVLKNQDEDTQMEFFHDISSWRDKYLLLQDTVAFLVATSDAAVGQDLRDRFMIVNNNWEQLFRNVEKYMHGGDVSRTKREYQEGLDKLDLWLRKAEDLLSTPQQVESERIRRTLETLMELHTEVSEMEEVFKNISRKFQQLVQELDSDEIEGMMFVLKKEKENLVIIRSMIPTKIQLFHHLLTQLEAIDQGEKEITDWCGEVERLTADGMMPVGTQEQLQIEYDKHKPFLSKTVNMQAMVQSKNNVFQSILKNTEGKEGIDTSEIINLMKNLNDRFDRCLTSVRQFEQCLTGGIRGWNDFMDAQKAVIAWVQEAQNLISVKHIDSQENVQIHKAFFNRNNDDIIANYLKTAQQLETHMNAKDRETMRLQTQNLKSKWDEIQAFAPMHMMKVEFRLDEEALVKYIKEVERQIQDENQAFQSSENVAQIIQQHMDFFNSTDLVSKVEGNLRKLNGIKNNYAAKMPQDKSLQEAYDLRKKQWDDITAKIQAIFSQLEQIPEQWREYEKKFSEMVRWMDSVDGSLAKMFKGITGQEDFAREKEGFQNLCTDVDSRREDMKWLVQKLDTLVSHRADDSGLSEQKRLEGLITRYKSMIPVIEMTMGKIDTYSRSYELREEIARVIGILENIQRMSVDEKFPDTEEAVQVLVDQQEGYLRQLDDNRSPVLSMLQRGKDLQRDSNCPEFLRKNVQNLETTWTDCFSRATERLKSLKEHLAVWQEYKSNKKTMLALLDESEVELKKIIPKHSQVMVQEDLKTKQSLKNEIKKATDDIMVRMKELADTLNSVADTEQQAALNDEVGSDKPFKKCS